MNEYFSISRSRLPSSCILTRYNFVCTRKCPCLCSVCGSSKRSEPSFCRGRQLRRPSSQPLRCDITYVWWKHWMMTRCRGLGDSWIFMNTCIHSLYMRCLFDERRACKTSETLFRERFCLSMFWWRFNSLLKWSLIINFFGIWLMTVHPKVLYRIASSFTKSGTLTKEPVELERNVVW